MKEIEQEIHRLSLSIANDKSFLSRITDLNENKEYDEYLYLVRNNNIPDYIVRRVKRNCEAKGITYAEALLLDRIYTLGKTISHNQAELEAHVRSLQIIRGERIINVEPEPEPEVQEPEETNGLENCPKLKAIGSPKTLAQMKANIKKISIAVHPDSKPHDQREAFTLIMCELTKLETELEADWKYFDPLSKQSDSHIKKLMNISCGLTKYQDKFNEILRK